MKKNRQNIMCLVIMVMIGLGASVSALAATDKKGVTPFIKHKYFNQNITLESFRENPREFFRSESAFNLLVGYVKSEIRQPLSNAEFIALMNTDQVRARACLQSETIRVGGLEGDQFYWFSRSCRPGEEIVQLRLGDRWIDVFSLACLNAKEDTTPVPAPTLSVATVQELPAEKTSGQNCRFVDDAVVRQEGVTTFVPAIHSCGCYAPAVFGFIQPQTQTSSEWVCD